MKEGIIRFSFELGRGFRELVIAAIPSAVGAGIISWIILLVLVGIGKSGTNPMDIQTLAWGMLVAQAIGAWTDSIIRQMQNRFSDGTIQAQILLPGNLFLHVFSEFFARHFVAFFVKASVVFSLGWAIVWLPEFHPSQLLLIFLLPIASAIWVLFYLLVSGWLFWSERIAGTRGILQKLVGITAGQFVPIGIMPAFIQTIAAWLPFIYGGYMIGHLFVHFEYMLFLKTLAISFLWIGILWGANIFLYRRGIRRLSINGG